MEQENRIKEQGQELRDYVSEVLSNIEQGIVDSGNPINSPIIVHFDYALRVGSKHICFDVILTPKVDK